MDGGQSASQIAKLTGFDAETQLMLRLWQKLDEKRRETALAVLKDLAAAGRRRKRKR